MLAYFVDYCRDFCNTYTVHAVAAGDRGRFADLFPAAERITREEAIRLGWSRVREAKRDGEHWPAGFAASMRQPTYTEYPATLAEALEACRAGTADLMDEREADRQLAADERAVVAAGEY